MRDYMHPIIDSLKKLSETAREVLPSLERYDYRKEAAGGMEKKLSLDLLPKPLSEIIESLLIYCCPVITRDDNIPRKALLNKQNLQTFIENYNATGDCSLTKQLCHIELEPVKDVAEYLKELGLTAQARLLDNAYEFGIKLRSSNREHQFCPIDHTQPPVQIHFTVPAEELSDKEKFDAQLYSDFCGIFKPGGLNSAQRYALYESFRSLLLNDKNGRQHLVITTALILLKTKGIYGKPLKGTFNFIRSTAFTALGMPDSTAKSYRETSLKPEVKPNLANYKEAAEKLLTAALRNTR